MKKYGCNPRLFIQIFFVSAVLALLPGFHIPVLNTAAECNEKYLQPPQATSDQSVPSITIAEIESPAPQGSFLPNLVTTPDGTALLSWIELAEAETHKIRFAIRQGNVWSQPSTIYTYKTNELFFTDPSAPAMLALADGTLVAQWVGKIKPMSGPFARNIYVSFSRDKGKNWSKPVIPHRDGKTADHSFVSMAPAGRSSVALFWLDGRKQKYSPPDSYDGPMVVMHNTVSSDGKLGQEVEIDSDVCSCCPTSAALTSQGLIVAYRDHTKEIRDISFARFIDNKWNKPQPVHKDNWEIDGCPVNGPSFSADGNRLAVAWFTAAREIPEVRVRFSENAGEKFNDAIRIDEGEPTGRPDVVLTGKDGALVSWVELTKAGLRILIRHVNTDGRRSPASIVWASSGGKSAGFPHLAKNGNHWIAAWTDPSGNKRIRTAVINMTGE